MLGTIRGRRGGEVGEDRVRPHHVLLHLDGEQGRVTRGGESGEIERHDVSIRNSRDRHPSGGITVTPGWFSWRHSVLDDIQADTTIDTGSRAE